MLLVNPSKFDLILGLGLALLIPSGLCFLDSRALTPNGSLRQVSGVLQVMEIGQYKKRIGVAIVGAGATASCIESICRTPLLTQKSGQLAHGLADEDSRVFEISVGSTKLVSQEDFQRGKSKYLMAALLLTVLSLSTIWLAFQVRKKR
jgi:hypothetical protein